MLPVDDEAGVNPEATPAEELDQLVNEVQQWFRNWTAERCFFQAVK